MRSRLQKLCETLYPDRVKQVNPYNLTNEIDFLVRNEPILSGVLQCVVNHTTLVNTINSSFLYCLGVCNEVPVCPVKRKGGSYPDIDVDFCMNRRGETIQYIRDKYGDDRVCQISTFSEFKPRGSIKDFARVQGEPISVGTQLTSYIPEPKRGVDASWEECLELSPELSNPEYKDIITMAIKAEGINRHRGVHAGGLAISSGPFTDNAPLCRGKHEEIVSQWDMNDLETAGLVKMDILGLTELTVLDTCLRLIKSTTGKTVDLTTIDMEDLKVYELIGRGDTLGLFQLGSSGIRTLCMQLKPVSIEEIAIISALYRPGPLDNNTTSEYVQRSRGVNPVTYLVPQLEPILNNTKGLLIYQEQAMRIATDLAGYTLEAADDLRKAIGKKKPEAMAKEELKLIGGMVKNGIKEEHARTLWQEIQNFAAYSFNKSHAVAYSFITFHTAYLKTYYPVQFHCALLSLHSRERDKLMLFLNECKRKDIPVLPPDINESQMEFTVINNVIKFGLAGIVGVGEKAALTIINERNKKPFETVLEFYYRTRSNKKIITQLAKAGAFNSLGLTRASILEGLDQVLGHKTEIQKYESKLASYNRKKEKCDKRKLQVPDKGVKIKLLKEPVNPVKPQDAEFPIVPELDLDILMAMEKEVLGVYVSSHPLYMFQSEINRYTTANTNSLEDFNPGEVVTLIGIISTIKHIMTRGGRPMCYIDFEDLEGHVELVVFSSLYEKLPPDVLQEGHIIHLVAKVDTGQGDQVRKLIALTLTELKLIKPKKPIKRIDTKPNSVQTFSIKLDNITPDLTKQIKDVIVNQDLKQPMFDLSVETVLGDMKFHMNSQITQSGYKKLTSVMKGKET